MEELIASYLAQRKECGLPLLGSFKIQSRPAVYDVVGKQIYPPVDEILFSEASDYLPENLIEYVSHIQHVTYDEAEKKLHNWCLTGKTSLDAGQEIIFDSIGNLRKNSEGIIYFERVNEFNLHDTISTERVIHKNDEHVVLVGDKETTSGVMNEFYRDEVIIYEKSSWKMWALILFIISLLVFCFHFYDHEFSVSTTGNQSLFPVANPPDTYSVPR